MKNQKAYNLLEVVVSLLLVSIISVNYLSYLQKNLEQAQINYISWQKLKKQEVEKLLSSNAKSSYEYY